ncbi:beta-mannosidase [Solitalea koreensis]|uniref:Beta-mannosidase B n=1 Tax=Solitalea koreensis TaxID=543615 RepID=A0A521BZ18_9SPHI|nr:glycoside hydrolase family 2 protein [Solitalea koreensis]SMO52427.1 beta-mannosidase [Solitalea koreensis]
MKSPKLKLIAPLALLSLNTFAQQGQADINLNTAWKFKQVDKQEWLPATVPGTVHTDLLANKQIPDPFFRNNEKEVQWVEKKDWVYETSFKADNLMARYDNIDLSFDGLDTYADVFLNDSLILRSDNMFVGHTLEVKHFLKPGDNKLRIVFHSPINYVMPTYNASRIKYPADNDQSDIKLSIFTRKAPYSFGWDWGPRLVTSGIWKPVKLHGWNGVKIENAYIQQLRLTNAVAQLNADLELNADRTESVKIKVSSPEGAFADVYVNQRVTPGTQHARVAFSIKNPKKWWPYGLGDQKLYTVQLEAIGSKGSAKKEERIGLRTIQVVNEPDSIGESFYVKVNGIPVFMKGANYVPADSFLPRVNKEKLENLLNDVKASNMNMLRIWGGGVYESDDFYNLADEKGILIWQDFMFACTMYPSNEAFLKNVKGEAEYNIKRLRNHASLALWCGNNEIAVAWKNWGWQKSYNYSQTDSLELINGYKKVFNELLPQAVKNLDINRFYFPSSPISNWGSKADFKKGDNHFWGVWHAEMPFEEYNTHIPRFMSEYGFQSFPDIITVKQFAQPEDYNISSEVMKTHQKSYKGNGLIKKYMEMYYREPKDFESFLYLGQVLQAEGIKTAIEAHRRNKPYCMGTLYWQLNDCWPVASWSSIDYFGRWKALQYFAKKAYSPLLINPYIENGNLKVYLISDELKDRKAELSLRLIDFSGNTVWSKKLPILVEANKSKVYYSEDLKSISSKFDAKKHVLAAQLNVDGQLVSSNLLFLDKIKNIELPKPTLKVNIETKEKGYVLKISTDVLAKNVYLLLPTDKDSFFSDNYFDLLPGQQRTIALKSGLTLDQVKANLQLLTLDKTFAKGVE